MVDGVVDGHLVTVELVATFRDREVEVGLLHELLRLVIGDIVVCLVDGREVILL